MGIGIGILLLVIGLILLFAIKEFPQSVQDVVDPTTVGWILVIAGVLSLVLGPRHEQPALEDHPRGGAPGDVTSGVTQPLRPSVRG